MRSPREAKDRLYEQVARIGKAVASPRRLEIIVLLCQGEKSVEALARQADLEVKNASAHLKELRAARLVDARREGRRVYYRLADDVVAALWTGLRRTAEARLPELAQLEREPWAQQELARIASALPRSGRGRA